MVSEELKLLLVLGEMQSIDEYKSTMSSAMVPRVDSLTSHTQTSSASNHLQSYSKREWRRSDSSPVFFQRRVTRDQASRWASRYSELKEFKIKTGHCDVPSSWPQNVALSKWVKHQRYQWKLFKSGKRSTISQERIRSLDSLEFVWEPHTISWEGHLRQLVEFQIKHGHSNVPARHENRSLANWVKHRKFG